MDPDERFAALINSQHQAICKIADYTAILNIIITILMDPDERFAALINSQHQAICKIADYTAILNMKQAGVAENVNKRETRSKAFGNKLLISNNQ